MRKTLIAAVAASALMATSAFAAPYNSDSYDWAPSGVAAGTGIIAGTAFGIAAYNTALGSSALAAAVPSSTAGAIAAGGVVGLGTVALVDAAIQPCAGFHAVFGANRDRCVNGQYVEYAPRRGARVVR